MILSQTHLGIALALFASLTTASAHALLKAGKDKLAVRALIGLTGLIPMLAWCFYVPPPSRTMMPWLALASLLHTTYQLVLIRAYSASDFAVAFPVARGIAPIATAALGVVLLGDRLTLPSLVGIAMVSAGLLSIALGRAIPRSGLLAAFAAGLLTTAYTVVDAHAIRLAPTAMTFIAWFFVLDGLMMLPIFIICRWGRVRELLRSEGRQGIAAGLTSLIGFGAALMALRITPTGTVSALRETSIVFAMLIAAFALKERVDRRRAGGAIIIAAGAILIVVVSR